jgi:hypothetical protein
MSHQTLAIIRSELKRHAIQTLHYVGMADEGLICALKAELGPGITIMDYFDRWGGSARFFGDSEGLALPPRPDWLEGVTCYQEGYPEADMLVFDLKGRDAEFLLRELLEKTPHRRPFRHVIVVTSAYTWCTRIPGHRWEQTTEFWIGTPIR